ncbi:hypothetical protein [Arthrobacter sp. Z1-15]
MRSDWVAASVRARSMAQRRVGAGTCRDIAGAPGLQAALGQLADSVYGKELVDGRELHGREPHGREFQPVQTLSEAHRATRRTVLWQLRVLAGWLPAGGTRLVRAAAAAFEVDNILALDLHLRREHAGRENAAGAATGLTAGASAGTGAGTSTGTSTGAETFRAFDLGGLATAWPRLQATATEEELRSALASSPWGDPGTETALPDILTAVWLRRLTAEAAAVRPWAAGAAALIAARTVVVDRAAPAPRLVTLLRPLLGTAWTGTGYPAPGNPAPRGPAGTAPANTPEPAGPAGPAGSDSAASSDTAALETLRSTLPPAAAQALDGVERPAGLWRAEAALAARIESDGFSLLRAGLPGPDVVLGAMAVLAADAWRVRAALASAAVQTGTSVVLDAVA